MHAPVMSEAQLLRAREMEISEALARFQGRKVREQVSAETPLSALVQRECIASGEEISLEEWGIRMEAIRALMAYLAQDGPHPVEVLRRLYAVGHHFGIAPFSELTFRERAAIFGDSHESHRWLLKQICIRPLQRNGARSLRAPGQKGRDASESASRVQKGNKNRANSRTAVAPKPKPKTRP